MTPYPHLASPVRVGPHELRNRVALLPHGLFFADPRELLPTDAHVAYYRERARGGAGLICTESSVVSADGRQGAPLVLSSNPACVAGYRRIAQAVHAEGAKVCGQLTHYGNQASAAVTRAPLLGPSSLPDVALREPARPLDAHNMARIRDDFAAGARHFVEAGFDLVELKIAHDGLLRQFLSPLTNDRDDRYGGSFDNRVRYPLEVAAAVRAAIGGGVALGARLVLDECLPGGYTLDDGIAMAERLVASGLFDYVNADVGIWASVHRVVPPMSIPEGYGEDAFARASAKLNVPVIAFGRIQTPAYAEQVLAQGKAAIVGMARQSIADPHWTRKALGGDASRIRPCTYCNQLCVGNGTKLLPVSCTVNPLVGNGEIRDAGPGKRVRVVVIGGGPAGLEAARVAAEQGAAVTLFEARDKVGGRLAVAAQARGRELWSSWIDWAQRELRHLGVAMQLGRAATERDVRAIEPDAVVIACGSSAAPSGFDAPAVVGLDEFLRGDAGPGLHVCLVDQGSAGMPLWTAALEAAGRGAASVAIVTPVPVIAGDTDGATFLTLYGELTRRQVRFATDCVATGFDGRTLQIVNVYGGAAKPIDTDLVVVSSTRVAAGNDLAGALADLRPHIIGDALAPRDAAAAIREGSDAGVAASNG